MLYDWDPDKAASNLVKHGVAFEAVKGFKWEAALIRATLNHETGEPHLLASGLIEGRLYAMVYSIETLRADHQPAQGEQQGDQSLCSKLSAQQCA